MHVNLSSIALVSIAATAAAKELPSSLNQSGERRSNGPTHITNMAEKKAYWNAEFEAGLLDSTNWPRLSYTKCIDGKAEAVKGDPFNTFRCKNIDLYDFINHATLGSPNGTGGGPGRLLTGSSSWGWTDAASGREFVASGMYDGTALLEVLPEGRLLHLGFIPCPAPTNSDAFWKEIRSYKHYVLIGSELENHGVQIFDMEKLLNINPADAPIIFDKPGDLAGHLLDLPEGATHNVVINEKLEYGVAVGARPINTGCKGGLIFFDLKDPANVKTIGNCNGDDGYVHDAQCLPYVGPDTRYLGRDICYGYNVDALTIYDVTDKYNSTIISTTSYQGATFTHQGWFLDLEWQRWLVMDDEIDELRRAGPAADAYPVTYIWDLADLQSPKQTGIYKGSVPSVDHNQYAKDGLVFQSNYGAGVRIYDVSSIPEDPTGDSVCEIAYLDIYPEDDGEPGGGRVGFSGTWSSWLFDSGFVFINTIERGAFLGKLTKRESCPKQYPCNADNCLRALRASSVEGQLSESQEFCSDFTDGWNAHVSAVPTYAAQACGANVISRVSSACSCLPTPTGA